MPFFHHRRTADVFGLLLLALAGGAIVAVPTGRPAGAATAEAQALLTNRRVSIYPAGRADLAAGRIDMRVIRLLQRASERHTFTVNSLKSGHSKYVISEGALPVKTAPKVPLVFWVGAGRWSLVAARVEVTLGFKGRGGPGRSRPAVGRP